jgi:protein-S-isoprenylcysteine O-methyltransferase
VTAAALVGLVASDLSTRRRPGDRVEDGRTGATVSVAIAVAVAVGAASLLRPGAAPLPRHPRTFGAGVALTWCGIALNRWGRRSLGPAYRPVVTVLADHEVVRRGPYRVVRHPMYAGTTLLCVGVGTALGTVPCLAAWTLPPLALVRRIRVEEAVLGAALGARYDDFARSRRRLVPGVW